jgi:hypothetical protein
MFHQARSFNQPLTEEWLQVVDIKALFREYDYDPWSEGSSASDSDSDSEDCDDNEDSDDEDSGDSNSL